MEISIWKVFTIFGIVSQWAAKALKDNIITLKEAAELAEPLARELGIPVQIELPGTEAEAEESEEKTAVSFDKINPEL